MKKIVILTLILLLGFSCAKKPEDKYPENYKRDYFNLRLFDKEVLLRTSNVSKKDQTKRQVIFDEGEEKLKKIFKGFELKSREKNEKIKVQFEITPQYIIAYREIEEDKKLYFEERLLLSRKNNKLRVPLFYLPIKGFGIFERTKNNLNEKTNIYSFKDMGKQNSTHVKLGTKEEERIEIKVEGLTAVDKKSIIDLETDLDLTKRYIYVPSTLGAPRDIAQTSPFFQGQEKIVQLGLSENGIEVYNIDPKKEFFKPVFKKRPSLDETPVMTIPGRYVHISCKKSRQNYCLPTYGPGQDSSKEWKSKRFFIPNLKGLRIHEKNLLDLQHLKSDGCWSQGNNTQYISHTLKKGVINIELEKNIKINNLSSACLNSYWTTRMRHFSFNVRHFYSLVALDKFIPKNKALRYKPVLYPAFDRKFFGFFDTTVEKLNPEGEFKRRSKTSFLSRWNPNRKKNRIYYFLTNSYIEEEKEIVAKRERTGNETIPSLKDITVEAVDSLNEGLKIAEAPFLIHLCKPKIKLKNNKTTTYFEDRDCQEKAEGKIESRGALSGDIRYNTIALIRASLGNGLLGYGPNVVHPETGEVLHAHVNMYEGNLKRQTRSLWTQISSNENRAWLKNKNQLNKIETKAIASNLTSNTNDTNNALETRGFNFNGREEHEVDDVNEISKKDPPRSFNELLGKYRKARQKVLNKNLFFADFINLSQVQESIISTLRKREEVKSLEKSYFHKNGRVKSWNELNRDQKDVIQRILLVHNFKSTLVHEIGHNLGLRHNFMGSVDKDNFYNEKDKSNKYKDLELKVFPTYSSVMDYAGNAIDSPIVPGKYDIAALKFAYARKVELKNGKTINLGEDSLEKALQKENYNSEEDLKSYKYCTDFEKSDNAYCNPFDHGHNLSLIADSMIKKYYSDYERINFRDDKNYFSINQTEPYFLSKFYLFNQMKMILSEWDYIRQNKLSMKDQEFEIYKEKKCPAVLSSNYPDECKEIEDAVKASHKIGDFFLSILKEKELTCTIFDYGPDQIPNIISIYKNDFKEEENFYFLNNFNQRKVIINFLKTLLENKREIEIKTGYDAPIKDILDFIAYIKPKLKNDNLFENFLIENKFLMTKFGFSGEGKKQIFQELVNSLSIKEPIFSNDSEIKEKQKKHLLSMSTYLSSLGYDKEKEIIELLKQDLGKSNIKKFVLSDKLNNLKDLSHFTYLPKSCFDDELLKYFIEKEKYEVHDQDGRYLVGFNDKNPEFRKKKLKNIAVRGIWPDKILAMESLIQRRPMFGRKIGFMNFLDLPDINKEFKSLLNNSLLNFPESRAEKSLGQTLIPSYNIPMNLKGILGVHSTGDLLDIRKGMFSFSSLRNGGFKEGLIKMISVKRKNETEPFDSKNHLFFNHDDTVYLAKKDNKITFQILSFLNRVELIENSTPEEVKLTIDESRKKALSKKKRDLFLDSQDASTKGKEELLRDFLAYKSFDGFSFLNRIEDFFIENESNNISFEEYYNLNNFKNDYDETKYGSKESKINNLFHKSKALSLGLDIRSNRKREDKTAFISNSMLNFAEEINQKKGLIKWNQNLINLIISVLEGTEKSEDLFAYDNLNKSPFVPEKRDQKEIIKQILKRKDIDKSKVKESLYKIHFHSFLPTKQVEIRGKIQRLIKNHPTTKDLPTKSWLKEFESSLRKKDDFFEAIKKAIEKWSLSSKRSIGYNNAKRERILTGEENFQTDKILILFFKKTKLNSFSEDVKANLLKKVDLNLFSYKYLPKSKIKKVSRIFNNFLSQGATYLPKEIKEINKSLNYHVNSPKKSSNDHLNELIKLKNKIKEVKKNPPAGNKEVLENLQEEALQELKSFIKKFPYSPKIKSKDKKELSVFKDIFSKYHKEQNIYWNGLISQYDKDNPLYLKSKIKALENDILYEEFKIILGLEDPVTLKEKINNNYKKIIPIYTTYAELLPRSERIYLKYEKEYHEKRHYNFQISNLKEQLSKDQIEELKTEIAVKKGSLNFLNRMIKRSLVDKKTTLYRNFFNNFLKNFSQKYNNLFNLTYNWFLWRKNNDFSFKDEFYVNDEIPGCGPKNWLPQECKFSIQEMISNNPLQVYKKGEELAYKQMKILNNTFLEILQFKYEGKEIFENNVIPQNIFKSLDDSFKKNKRCKYPNSAGENLVEGPSTLKNKFNTLYNCTKNLFETGINAYLGRIENDLDNFLKTHSKEYYRGPYPIIFNKFLINKESFQKFKESGLMVLALPDKNRSKIISELIKSSNKKPIDELEAKNLDDLFLFELETFSSKEGRGLLLNLKKTYQGVLKTLPTEWKQQKTR